jgi:hypothetical protein
VSGEPVTSWTQCANGAHSSNVKTGERNTRWVELRTRENLVGGKRWRE